MVADVASGTGIWTRVLLENGNPVFGSRAECRDAGRRESNFSRLSEVHQRRRDSGGDPLADASVDFVTAAQAAHWFDRERARREFVRILKPGGWLVLLWNERVTDSTPFLREYEQLLLTYGTDYADVRHENTTEALNEFFDPAPFQERVFDLRQDFDYAGLEGRLLSSSYAPGPGHPKYAAMLRDLRELFDRHAVAGRVSWTTSRGFILDGWMSRYGHGKKPEPRRTLRFTKEKRYVEVKLSEKSFHMTPDEFRRHGHAMVDWIADYQSRVESFPVFRR